METTKKGNIKIKINPERKHQGQFVGYRFFKLSDVRRAFPDVPDFAEIKGDGYDLGEGATNEEMIIHHLQPFRSCGYIVE